ncbi:hypothetical protein TNCV_1327151 [Trichonephila clavipes]|nr:hypothetical protein TNCV_1327151 [Trichonephila clavipes]
MPAQESFSSLDHGSKLRGLLPIALVQLYSENGSTSQYGPWPSQETFSRPAFFLQVFSNSSVSKLEDSFLGHQSI